MAKTQGLHKKKSFPKSSESSMLKRGFDKLNHVLQPLLAIAVFFITILQFKQANEQAKIVEVQTEMAAVQESIDLLLFVREYINGFVYLYDIVSIDSVKSRVFEIRGVGLPAVAAPSQYSNDHWVIISHSLGRFPDEATAKSEILHWRETMKKWEYLDKSKTELFERYEEKFKAKNVTSLVFFYKADIVKHREYFEKLVKSKSFFIDPLSLALKTDT